MEHRAAGARLLEGEQFSFDVETPSVTRKLATRTDSAMAWDEDRHRIGTVGMADSARRRGTPDACGNLAVAARGALGNRQEFTPYEELKRSASDIQRHLASRRLAAQIALNGFGGKARDAVVTGYFGLVEVAAQFALLPLVGLMHRKRADAARGCCDQHSAERRLDNRIADLRAATMDTPTCRDNRGDSYWNGQMITVIHWLRFVLLAISIPGIWNFARV